MASCSTTPRRLPTWIVPDGVLESLMTCSRPLAAASRAISSAQYTAVGVEVPAVMLRLPDPSCRRPPSADADDLVGPASGRNADLNLVPLAGAEQCRAYGRFVRDAPLRRVRSGRPNDAEVLFAVF